MIGVLEIMSRKHALEIFRGTLPPRRSADYGKWGQLPIFSWKIGSCPSFTVERSEEVQGRKMSSVQREHGLQNSRCMLPEHDFQVTQMSLYNRGGKR
jgi:hypothetical protein